LWLLTILRAQDCSYTAQYFKMRNTRVALQHLQQRIAHSTYGNSVLDNICTRLRVHTAAEADHISWRGLCVDERGCDGTRFQLSIGMILHAQLNAKCGTSPSDHSTQLTSKGKSRMDAEWQESNTPVSRQPGGRGSTNALCNSSSVMIPVVL